MTAEQQLRTLATAIRSHDPIYMAFGSAELGTIGSWGDPDRLSSRFVHHEVFRSKVSIGAVHASISRYPPTHLPQLSQHGVTLGLLFPFDGQHVLGIFLDFHHDISAFMLNGYQEIKSAVVALDWAPRGREQDASSLGGP